MRFKIRLLLLVTCYCLHIHAQDKRWGIQAGLNRFTISDLPEFHYTYLTGMHLGIVRSYNKYPFTFTPGVLYVKKGAGRDVNEKYAMQENRFILNCLEFKCAADIQLCKCNLMLPGSGPRIGIEPYFDYNIGGEVIDGFGDYAYSRDMVFGYHDKADGVRTSCGVKFYISMNCEVVEPYVGYDIGITGLSKKDNSLRNMGVYWGLIVNL
ncbi:hypothetical protein K4L44_05515 [Halosquirtibacter laminarini]|uniref:Uncharacterized protein n=1 Tax=Halosquirtibacter laminarini TaxID=3374600 RepID=A0AC61NHZ5_9BACT|nr:hypothetical protein K4L44_05515 [Prolixibacteraceae bacterium]